MRLENAPIKMDQLDSEVTLGESFQIQEKNAKMKVMSILTDKNYILTLSLEKSQFVGLWHWLQNKITNIK